jgi:hypothetical protein
LLSAVIPEIHFGTSGSPAFENGKLMKDDENPARPEEEATKTLNPVHATTIHLAVNNSDFIVVFGEIRPLFGSRGLVPSIHLEPVAAVTMSPITAKQLCRGLTKAIENFEQESGSKIPEMGLIEDIGGSNIDE